MKKILLAGILLLFLSFSIYSGDNTTDSWRDRANKFRLEAIGKDLVYADLNQLKSIARSLGLDEGKNANELRSAIAQYYGSPSYTKPSKTSTQKIYIQRAGELEMIKLEEEDENNLQILGKAKLKLETFDEDRKKSDKFIEADEIFINTKSKEITGVGNVYFEDDRLQYRGNQFYYNYELNRGILLEGRTKLLKGGDSGLDGAYFTGKKVLQTAKDDIILQDGMLTTCDEDNPHYYLNVSRLWVSEKGEWGILNGILNVGPVTFFYLPIYYHPKELKINPGFGFRSREGWYFNSTYYFFENLKQKKAGTTKTQDTKSNKETTLTDDKTAVNNRRRVPTNLFSLTGDQVKAKLKEFYEKHKFYEKYPAFKVYPKFNSIDFGLTAYADAYTNIGLYTGLYYYMNVKYDNYPFTIKYLTDYGLSRRIWQEDESGSIYIPYNPDHKTAEKYVLGSNDFDSENNTYFNFAANPLLLRHAQWFNMAGSLFGKYLNFKYELQVEYASDQHFYADFYNRKESFSYLDLLGDTISYSVLQQDEGMANLETTGQGSLSASKNIDPFLTVTLSPKKDVPGIFGLKPFTNLSLTAESRLTFKAKDMPLVGKVDNYAERYTGADDFFAHRYMLSSFTAPKITGFGFEGTLLDYTTFAAMPDAYNKFKKTKKETTKEKKIEKNLKEELFFEIEKYKKNQADPDKTEIDYMMVLPFYSQKLPIEKKDIIDIKYKYTDVLIGNEDFSYKEMIEEAEEDTGIDYYRIVEPVPFKTKSSISITPIDFNLKYYFSDKMTNTFEFESEPVYPELDTLQYLFCDTFDIHEILKEFKVENELKLKFTGSLSLLKFTDSSLLSTKMDLVISYSKHYNDLYIYTTHMKTTKESDEETSFFNYAQQIENKRRSLDEANKKASKLTISYNDIITNDLSFGNYIITGTKIVTNVGFDIFEINELKGENYARLNELNQDNEDYVPVDPGNYFLSIPFIEKISKLSTVMTLNFNIFPQGSDHSLTMGASSTINWVPVKQRLSTLKNEIWEEKKGTIDYDYETFDGYQLSLTDEAKEYLYYNGKDDNLQNKISEYYANDFFKGANYYRDMFSDVSYNLSYAYKRNNVQIINFSNSLTFRLNNIGIFTNEYGYHIAGVYPDNNFTISLFKSLLSYSFKITFNKVLNPRMQRRVILASKKGDQFKIIKMTMSHVFGMSVPFSLFNINLSGNIVKFDTTFNFKWDRSFIEYDAVNDSFSSKWANNSDGNYLFLDTQKLDIKLFMDILQVSLTFKHFDFSATDTTNTTGYGFTLDNGSIILGYNITQIPVFLRYFKFTMHPSLSYRFVVNNPESISSNSFYTGNVLTLAFSADLVIGKGEFFETKISFSIKSENKKMYQYYPSENNNSATEAAEKFFEDIEDSFAFGDIERRRKSSFNLKELKVSISHDLHDWNFSFSYIGMPKESKLTQKSNWENNFEFAITWKGDKTDNQLMKMFNKTTLDAAYNKGPAYSGEWEQPVLSLDPDKQ